MTATNHALTGAVIALAIKRPEFAIPLAFLSHFAVDAIPHYNPAGVKGFNKLKRKFKDRAFWWIFGVDMIAWPVLLISLPLLLITNVSPATIFFSMLAAVSPDFIDGYNFLIGLIWHKKAKPTWFDRFCIAIQIYEKPPGLAIEALWLALMVYLISKLTGV